MLENPELLRQMVERSGAHGTNEESEENVEHLCSKCDKYAMEWAPVADKIWNEQNHKKNVGQLSASNIEATNMSQSKHSNPDISENNRGA